jgi:gamma-glutamyltranspeptidase
MGDDVIAALRAIGHSVVVLSGVDRVCSKAFCGRGQIIYRDASSGVLWGGSDGRGDGMAVGY